LLAAPSVGTLLAIPDGNRLPAALANTSTALAAAGSTDLAAPMIKMLVCNGLCDAPVSQDGSERCELTDVCIPFEIGVEMRRI